MIFIWCKNLDISFFRFVTIHAFDRRAEIPTDRQTVKQTASIQRGKIATAALDQCFLKL